MATPVIAEQELPDSLSAYGIARSTVKGVPLSPEELAKTDAYWRACKYLEDARVSVESKRPSNP